MLAMTAVTVIAEHLQHPTLIVAGTAGAVGEHLVDLVAQACGAIRCAIAPYAATRLASCRWSKSTVGRNSDSVFRRMETGTP